MCLPVEVVKKKCDYLNTPAGCKNGKNCPYRHSGLIKRGSCFVCGSTQHMADKCTRRGAVPKTAGPKPKGKNKANPKGKAFPQGGGGKSLQAVSSEVGKLAAAIEKISTDIGKSNASMINSICQRLDSKIDKKIDTKLKK